MLMIRFSLFQRIILWATACCVMVAVMYPATRTFCWGYNGTLVEMHLGNGSEEELREHPWMKQIGDRKLIVLLEQREEQFGPRLRLYVIDKPDFRRMCAEIAISVFVGGGLVFALRGR